MLVINADDWGGWQSATDAALTAVEKGTVTAVSAMVFMDDSERARDLAQGRPIDVGLHLNFTQAFTGAGATSSLKRHLEKTSRYLMSHRLAPLVYNPLLRQSFQYLYAAQRDEFARLYGRIPERYDGHLHMHLSSNLIVHPVVPRSSRVRATFTFFPNEKSALNRLYRRTVNRLLRRRYTIPKYFFSLEWCLAHGTIAKVLDLARTTSVELMTHPEYPAEFKWLTETHQPLPVA
jgi:predicted glycoside hydrolase/deacetylase ChbG (UPF0249 family)